MNPALPTYFLQILQEQWSAVQVLIFVLNSSRDVEFFSDFDRRSRNLEAREDILPEP